MLHYKSKIKFLKSTATNTTIIPDQETKYYGEDVHIIVRSSIYVDNFPALKKYILTIFVIILSV